jgi:hypothetical protein
MRIVLTRNLLMIYMHLLRRAEVPGVLVLALALLAWLESAAMPAGAAAVADRGYAYTNDIVAQVPWSVHVVKLDRRRTDLELDTTMGEGSCFGMETVSRQVAQVPREAGQPVAAINGDYYNRDYTHSGDPQGIQISRGQLVSGPNPTRVAFWVDAKRDMHRGTVTSLFHVVWCDGAKIPMGLNESRRPDSAVLYTAAAGRSTLTSGGLEIALISSTNQPWLPLKVGTVSQAKVLMVHEAGNMLLRHDVAVISIGPRLAARLPRPPIGSMLTVSTETLPSLNGARTALGGGPTLLSAGRPWQWPNLFQSRHPRSCIGWNKDSFFMMEVDGRQAGSDGMTYFELADYLRKLGCDEAMNLDGGGSATLWADGRVMNRPSEGLERPAANSLVLLRVPKK